MSTNEPRVIESQKEKLEQNVRFKNVHPKTQKYNLKHGRNQFEALSHINTCQPI